MLRSLPYIAFNKHTWVGQHIAAKLQQRGIHIQASIEIDSLEAIENLVADGFGVSIVPLRLHAHRNPQARQNSLWQPGRHAPADPDSTSRQTSIAARQRDQNYFPRPARRNLDFARGHRGSHEGLSRLTIKLRNVARHTDFETFEARLLSFRQSVLHCRGGNR